MKKLNSKRSKAKPNPISPDITQNNTSLDRRPTTNGSFLRNLASGHSATAKRGKI